MTLDAYLGFGSNLGDRRKTFERALAELAHLETTKVKCCSSLFETEPEGLSDGGPLFINAAIALETELAPEALIRKLRSIEMKLGKTDSHRSDLSRNIDLDLLLFGNESVQTDDLQIPHPRMHQRAFVLVPLAEIAPEAIHPVMQCSVKALLDGLGPEDLDRVKRIVELM